MILIAQTLTGENVFIFDYSKKKHGVVHCKDCGGELVAKNKKPDGLRRIPKHYAHKVESDCERNNKGEWHLSWQYRFKELDGVDLEVRKEIDPVIRNIISEITKDTDYKGIPRRNHLIADVLYKNELVVEIQYSPISFLDIKEREMIHNNMIWILNGENKENDIHAGTGDYQYMRKPVFFDFPSRGVIARLNKNRGRYILEEELSYEQFYESLERMKRMKRMERIKEIGLKIIDSFSTEYISDLLGVNKYKEKIENLENGYEEKIIQLKNRINAVHAIEKAYTEKERILRKKEEELKSVTKRCEMYRKELNELYTSIDEAREKLKVLNT